MREPGRVERRQPPRPEVVAAIAGGMAAGGLVGVAIRGSGSIYTSLFLAGGLLVVVVLAGLAAVWATIAGRSGAARALAAFTTVALIAAGVGYALGPPYRSPDADLEHPGTVVVHVAQPEVMDWRAAATCRSHPPGASVSMVFMPYTMLGDRWVAVLLRLVPTGAAVRTDLTISISSPTAGSADYVATTGADLSVTDLGTGARSGHLRFTAVRVPGPSSSRATEPDRLGGTLDWSCQASS
ncbi:MAG: hypothetical protein AB1627_05435 [Chloroflexota bacterium]